MKKAISILLVLVIALSMCMSLSACGSRTIKLTKDNFDDYFTYNIGLYGFDNYGHCSSVSYDGGKTYSAGFEWGGIDLHSKGQLSGSVTAVSQNYSYSDLTIRVKVTATCGMISRTEYDSGAWSFDAIDTPITYETEIKVDLNVAGEGEITDNGYCTFPSNLLCARGSSADTIEIIEITGTVTPIG